MSQNKSPCIKQVQDCLVYSLPRHSHQVKTRIRLTPFILPTRPYIKELRSSNFNLSAKHILSWTYYFLHLIFRPLYQLESISISFMPMIFSAVDFRSELIHGFFISRPNSIFLEKRVKAMQNWYELWILVFLIFFLHYISYVSLMSPSKIYTPKQCGYM